MTSLVSEICCVGTRVGQMAVKQSGCSEPGLAVLNPALVSNATEKGLG